MGVMQTVKEGEEFSFTVDRETEDGESEEIELKAVNFPVKMKQQFVIRPMLNPTEEQLNMRRKWLSSN